MTLRATSIQIERLAVFSTCELADALVKLKHPTGGYIPDLERFSGDEGMTLVGEAFTVEMVDARETDAPKIEGHFVDAVERGTVCFISIPPQVKNASLGGLLATALSVKGVKGCVTSGWIRDLSEMRELGFPVFARGHSILGQSPFTRVSRLQLPLTIHPVPPASSAPDIPSEWAFPPTVVHPYDIVVADADGVLVVRPESLEEVLTSAQEGREVDERCLRDLKEGKGVAETFKRWRGK
ncbi:hypothetical protein JCM8547_003228 [Rhodosporidiobolus lusitaniae]